MSVWLLEMELRCKSIPGAKTAPCFSWTAMMVPLRHGALPFENRKDIFVLERNSAVSQSPKLFPLFPGTRVCVSVWSVVQVARS